MSFMKLKAAVGTVKNATPIMLMRNSNPAQKGVVIIVPELYNSLGVINMNVSRECVKALIDQLSDEQVQALWVILQSITLPTEELTPEEITAIAEARNDIKAGKGIKAEEVWDELGN
jgi:hypothetical protein